jgi:hypothetical protein
MFGEGCVVPCRSSSFYVFRYTSSFPLIRSSRVAESALRAPQKNVSRKVFIGLHFFTFVNRRLLAL